MPRENHGDFRAMVGTVGLVLGDEDTRFNGIGGEWKRTILRACYISCRRDADICSYM